jgi:general secretion pathway protein C
LAQALRFDSELVSQLIARAPRLVMGLLILLLAVRATLLVSQLAGPPGGDAAGSTPPLPATTRSVVDVPSILRANLFGQSVPVQGATDAPVTSMSLLLAGVIAASDEKRGFAMIGTSSADIKFYKVGDMVPGGAQLFSVFVDRVLLDRSGTIEALLIPPRTGMSFTMPPAPVADSVANSMERVQQLMRESSGVLGEVILRQAEFADGKLRGMRVYPGANSQAFNRLGLKPGDLVTSINGTQLDDQTRLNEVFNSLNGAAESWVTVLRNGTQQELRLNLAEVANEAERLARAPPPPAKTAAVLQPAPKSAR